MKKCCSGPVSEDEVHQILSLNGFKRTKAKVQILTKILQAQAPVSVSELHDHMGKNDCDVSTVFRAVVQFRDKGIIKEVKLGEDFSRFEFVKEDSHHHHHHHVRCRNCGDIQTLDKCDIKIFEKAIHRLGFRNMEHNVEFSGICKKCS